MVELADTIDLGSIGNSCAGSSPVTCTKQNPNFTKCRVRVFVARHNISLDSNNKINYFYDIPTTKSEHGKIFKGWCLDRNNEKDSNPIKWDNDEYKTEVNIYAHWIDVGTVNKDAEDTKIFDKDKNVNGVDTTGTYNFVQNVDCTSSVGGYKNTSIVDHRNYDDYRIYSLVITYKKVSV